ncbi:hypothetical protein WAI453_003545 [Rhynchosporium graminicola]
MPGNTERKLRLEAYLRARNILIWTTIFGFALNVCNMAMFYNLDCLLSHGFRALSPAAQDVVQDASTESGKFITTLPKLAMKVFWKVISADEAKTLLDGETAEGLMLPGDIVAAIGRNLAESALCLPPSARKFNKEWDVALMNRYQPSR